MKHLPILTIGSYGLHVLKNPAGTYSFVGTIPEPIWSDKTGKTPVFTTERKAIEYVASKMPDHTLDLTPEGLHRTED